jgi:hypothetical protein
VRKLLTISVLFLAAASCLRAQDQERKLVDRLLRPDMTLQSSEQKKKFTADGTSINKKASVGTFYVEKKPDSKAFSKTREFSTRQLDSRPFHGNRSAFESSSQHAVFAMRLNPTKRLPVAYTRKTGLSWIRVKAKSRLTGKTRRSRSTRCASC